MANKRLLKKQIRYACGDLAGECILAMKFVEGIDVDKLQDIIFEIASLQTETLKKISFSFDKVERDFENSHVYSIARAKYFHKAYKTLRNEFYQKVQDVVNSMNVLLPQAQKDANKKALNR